MQYFNIYCSFFTQPGKGPTFVPTLQINFTTFHRCLRGKQNSLLLGVLCLHHVGAMSKLAVVGRTVVSVYCLFRHSTVSERGNYVIYTPILPLIYMTDWNCRISLQPQELFCNSLIWSKQLLDGSPQNVWTSRLNYPPDEAGVQGQIISVISCNSAGDTLRLLRPFAFEPRSVEIFTR